MSLIHMACTIVSHASINWHLNIILLFIPHGHLLQDIILTWYKVARLIPWNMMHGCLLAYHGVLPGCGTSHWEAWSTQYSTLWALWTHRPSATPRAHLSRGYVRTQSYYQNYCWIRNLSSPATFKLQKKITNAVKITIIIIILYVILDKIFSPWWIFHIYGKIIICNTLHLQSCISARWMYYKLRVFRFSDSLVCAKYMCNVNHNAV